MILTLSDVIIVIMDRLLIRVADIEPVSMLYISHRVTAGRLKSFKRRVSLHQKPIIASIEPSVGSRLTAPSHCKSDAERVSRENTIGTRMCEVMRCLPLL